jgi:hypothetical protein
MAVLRYFAAADVAVVIERLSRRRPGTLIWINGTPVTALSGIGKRDDDGAEDPQEHISRAASQSPFDWTLDLDQ